MATTKCQNCGQKSDNLVGQLVKVPNATADIKMVCPPCKVKLSKRKK